MESQETPLEFRATNLPDGLIIDIGPMPVSLLPPTVFVNGRAYWPSDEPVSRTWSLPPEPGPEVTAVRDKHGCRWQIVYAAPAGAWSPRPDASEAEFHSWRLLLFAYGPLTDASGEVQP